MTDDLPDVPALRVLEPPIGGLDMLRTRLDDPARRRWWLLAVPAVAVAAAILFVVLRPREADRLAPAPTALAEPAVEGVRFYWVASTPAARAERRTFAEPPVVAPTISVEDAPHVPYTPE